MSFLNALASDGLSVGLRLYTERLNAQSPARAAEASSCQEAPPTPASGPAVESEETKPQRKPAPAPLPQTPEEQAAGRAEAQARLASDAAIGQLQTAKQANPAAKSENPAEGQEDVQGAESSGSVLSGAAAAAGSSKGLTPEEEKEVARLKERESQIKAEVQSAVNRGVDGASTAQFSYTTGPDEQRYVSGLQDGQSGAGNPDAKSPEEDDSPGGRNLSEEEQKQVEEMKQRDREVHTHEQAHVSAAAGMAGAPVYEYETGPDGQRYAVAGHVDVKTSGSSNPDTALREAEAVKRAANAPADPSSADRAAAASAAADINRLKAEKVSQDDEDQEQGARAQGELHSLKTDERADMAAPNGSSFNRQVLGAYAAAKFGALGAAVRPALAQA